VSPACDNCFAKADTKRYGFCEWGKDVPRRVTSLKYWEQLSKWNRDAQREGARKRVFVGSWCDLMEDRPELQMIREQLCGLIEENLCLDFLLVTKRPQNFRRFLPAAWLDSPRPNVWGMTTVENADYKWREKALLDTPFAVRGLSMEPLLGPVEIDPRIDWVITGGESGPRARPSDPDWFRSLRDQCATAGVSFFFKQHGEYRDFVKLGKKAAGALLDGREWREVPNAA